MAHGASHAHGDSHGTLREFALDFVMGGLAAGVAKTAAAPIERVKLLIQNQVRTPQRDLHAICSRLGVVG